MPEPTAQALFCKTNLGKKSHEYTHDLSMELSRLRLCMHTTRHRDQHPNPRVFGFRDIILPSLGLAY